MGGSFEHHFFPQLLACFMFIDLLHYNWDMCLLEALRYVIITITCFYVLISLACDCQLYLTCYTLPHKSQEVFLNDEDLIVEDIDFSDKYLALILREGRNFRLGLVKLPLPIGKVKKENLLYHALTYKLLM